MSEDSAGAYVMSLHTTTHTYRETTTIQKQNFHFAEITFLIFCYMYI